MANLIHLIPLPPTRTYVRMYIRMCVAGSVWAEDCRVADQPGPGSLSGGGASRERGGASENQARTGADERGAYSGSAEDRGEGGGERGRREEGGRRGRKYACGSTHT